jgi:flagellin-like protein
MSKKGISPVIATVLLISLVLILAAIIFMWARSFLPEQIQKFGSPVADSCKEVGFEAEYTATTHEISIINRKNIPIYRVQVGKKSGLLGSVSYLENSTAQSVIGVGESGSFGVEGVASGDELVIIPVLLGEVQDTGEKKAFACGSDYAYNLVV